jgi:SPOR domain
MAKRRNSQPRKATQRPPPPDGLLDHVSPWVAGGCGGAFSSLAKFFGTTLNDFLTAAFAWDVLAVKMFIAFMLASAGFWFCGGLVAYFLQEKTQNRWHWFFVAMAITSAGGTALPGVIKFLKIADIAPISTAYAGEPKYSACDNIQNFTVLDGLSKFFGITASGYRVVVGSFKDPAEAQAYANKVNAEDPSIGAFVGDRAPCNEYYPVVVGHSTSSLSAAKTIQIKAQKLELGTQAYISFRK